MRQLSTATSLLLGALLVVVPLAAAASAHGQLTVSGAATIPGASTVTAPSGQLVWAAPLGAPTLSLRVDDAKIRIYGHEETFQKTPLGPNVTTDTSERPGAPESFGPSPFSLEGGTAGGSVVLRSTGPIQADLADAQLFGVSAAYLGSAKPSVAGGQGPCPADVPCFDAWGVHGIETRGTDAPLTGDVTLLVYGPTVIIGDKRYATGVTETSSGTATTKHDLYALATLHGVVGKLHTGDLATWFVPSPTIAAGALLAPTAGGIVDVGSKSYHATDEPLDVAGTLTLAPAPVPAGTSWGENGRIGTQHARAFGLAMSGDVQRINLRATPVFVDAAPATLGIAAAIAVALGVIAYSWQHLAFGAASLYTRLKQPQLLENEVRNAIYEIIRTNPGISARAVHRSSSQSWGTVVYHLRQLERHHLVVSRSLGRTRNYYENHGKYKGMEIQLACLQSPRARALARLVLTAPGIVQEDLSAGSGYPQPTTSYYVRKLKAAGLVEERREGRYARYHPLGDLQRFLEIAEASATPAVGGLADAAVDA